MTESRPIGGLRRNLLLEHLRKAVNSEYYTLKMGTQTKRMMDIKAKHSTALLVDGGQEARNLV